MQPDTVRGTRCSATAPPKNVGEFATNFGKSSADADYDAKFDLDGGEDIGFGDLLQFALAFES